MSVTIVTTRRLNVEFTNDIQAEMLMLNLSLCGVFGSEIIHRMWLEYTEKKKLISMLMLQFPKID